MKEKWIHKYNHIWVPGLVTFIVFAAVYCVDGFFPFGTGSVAALDLNTQYLPLLYKFYDTVKGAGGVVIDYHIAGGANLYAEMVTELVNPFNYILLLFRREQLYLAVNLLPMLYGVAASVTASFAMGRVVEKKSFVRIVLSVCYGLSFYNAYQFEIIRWMYLVVLFPLFAVSLKNLLEEGRALGYTLLLAYQLILSLQLGFQTCLFTLCASICCMLYLHRVSGGRKADGGSAGGDRSGIGRRCLTLGCATAAALMISAVNVVPAVFNILRSARSAENRALIFVIEQHGLDDILERLLEIGHPVVLGVLAGAALLRAGRKHRQADGAQPQAGRKRRQADGAQARVGRMHWQEPDGEGTQAAAAQKYAAVLLLWLLATVVLQPVNLLWHLGYYQCFPVRYGYMVLFVLILITAKSCADLSEAEPAGGKTGALAAAISALLCIAALIFAAAKRLMFSYAFATLAVSSVCIKETLLFYALMLLLTVSAALAYALSAGACGTKAAGAGRGLLLTVAAVAGAVFYLCILFPQGFEARTENEAAYRAMGERGNHPVPYSEAGHINDRESMLLNEPLVSGAYALTAYMPAGADLGFSEAMDDLGYSSPWISVRSEGGTVVSDVLLGIHNPYVPDINLSNGMLVSREAYECMEQEVKLDSSILRQKSILTAMCSETSFEADDIMEVWHGEAVRDDGALPGCFEVISPSEIQIDVKEPVLVYACTDNEKDNLLVNGTWIEKEEAHQSQNPFRIYCLGKYAQEKVTLSLVDGQMHSGSADGMTAAVIRLNAFRSMCEELEAENAREIEPDGRRAGLYVHSKDPMEGVLMLPFAYLEGYRARGQGEDAETDAVSAASFLNGLLCVKLAKPVSELAVTFRYDILKPALFISLAGILFLGLILLHPAGRVLCAFAKVLFILTAALFLLNVYAAPILGSAGYMVGRLFGKDLLASYRTQEDDAAGSGAVLLQAEADEEGIHVVVAGENLVTALGARLSADTEESRDFKAQKAGDGIINDASSRWSSENDWESADHYLQVDLKSEQTICALRIFWFQRNAKAYEILVSGDRSFADSTVAASFTEAPASKEQVVFFENPLRARYLRIAVQDVNKNEEDLSLYYQNISIEELEIYGDDSESFVIETPVLTGGRDREIPMPEVPDGYRLSVGGINYGNLLADENHFADTYAPVRINLGYVLTCGNTSFDLPGFDVVLPASDGIETLAGSEAGSGSEAAGGPGTDSGLVSAAGMGTGSVPASPGSQETGSAAGPSVCGVNVREWKPAEGICQAASGRIARQVDGSLIKELGEEGYRIEISKEEIALSAASEKGMCWADITLEEMMRNASELPCGIIRDYPAYPVRGFCIDAGRRPISMEMLYEIVDALSAKKMNTLQIHLNDNAIIAESEYDGTVEGARGLYSAFRLESDMTGETGEKLSAGDMYYTKEAFKALTEYALQKGVEIVPEIDTPAHSMAFTKIMPSLGYKGEPELADTLDISRPEALAFAGSLWEEYLSGSNAVFEKCGAVHIGMDEYYGKPAPYEAYLSGLAGRVRALAPDKKIRIWGSLSAVGADLNKIPKNLEIMLWSTYWADPEMLYRAGFKLINCQNSDLYIIVGGGTDHLDTAELSQNWQPGKFMVHDRTVELPAWSDRMLGACYALWNDHYTKGIDSTTEAELMERIKEPLGIIAAKLW